MADEPVIASAVASMTGQGTRGSSDGAINARIQAAMVAAVNEAQTAGVTDIETLRAAQIAARDRVLTESAGA